MDLKVWLESIFQKLLQESLRVIKKLNPEIQAITFSGHAGNTEMAESIEAGAIKCLTKPFEIAQLKED